MSTKPMDPVDRMLASAIVGVAATIAAGIMLWQPTWGRFPLPAVGAVAIVIVTLYALYTIGKRP